MSTPKQTFFALAATHGIDVQYSAGRKRHPRTGEPVPYELLIEAPVSKVFAGSGVHQDCTHAEGEACDADWRALTMWLQNDVLKYGIADCTDPECDWCADRQHELEAKT